MGMHVKVRDRKKTLRQLKPALIPALLLLLGVLVFKRAGLEVRQVRGQASAPVQAETAARETAAPAPEATQEPPAAPKPLEDFSPHAVDTTQPTRLITSTAVAVDGAERTGYTLPDRIDFGRGADYTDAQGIVTFRGDNFRSGAAYGTAQLTEKKLAPGWTVASSALTAPDGQTWTGSGWVGQPLMMTWPKETRQKMNMYDWAKNADSLTEVIYATMGGVVYFIDLQTGEKTRDDLNLGYTFKGAGALDPRGYPILYLGSGYDSTQGKSRVFIINLYDCSTMYTFGNEDPFSLRGKLSFFDGSPLVDAETDQLIYPGENGILYILKLGTQIDENAGTLSVSPSRMVKWRYLTTRSDDYYLGMEDSAVIWRGHIIMSDNGGNLMCLNLETLTLDWAQDVLDDTNCSPVLELEDGHPYVYISTSFHAGWRAPEGSAATIPVWKIDAETGEIVWHTDYDCYTLAGVSGGVQGTAALGKNSLSELIFVPVARTPTASGGKLVALDKKTGAERWVFETQMYAWSSPVAVYDSAGNGYIVYCTAGGYMYLLDGLTGEVLDSMDLGSNIEASPAVYNDMAVVGTRGQKICGVRLT